MTPATDPHRRFARGTVLRAGGAAALAILAGGWAWWVPAPEVAAPVDVGATSVVSEKVAAAAAISPSTWNVTLWRGAGDGTAVAAPGNLPLTLYSVLQDGAGWTAAVAAGDGGALQYVKAGDTCNGFTVVRVDASGVVLRRDGQEQRLGLAP